MTYSVRGENKSPAFEFHWNLGTNPTSAPDSLPGVMNLDAADG